MRLFGMKPDYDGSTMHPIIPGSLLDITLETILYNTEQQDIGLNWATVSAWQEFGINVILV